MSPLFHTNTRSQLLYKARNDDVADLLLSTKMSKYLSFPAAIQLFLTALAVVQDEGFRLPSPQAAEARRTEVLLNQWCEKEQNQQVLHVFCEKLVTVLAAPFKDVKFKKDQSAARFVSQRAKMWGRYHLTRTSVEFKTLWCTFIESNINCAATPTLYQFITDIV